MTFDEIPLARRSRLDVEISGGQRPIEILTPDTECAFFRNPRGSDVLLTAHAEAFLVSGATDESNEALNECIDRDLARISWIVGAYQEGNHMRAVLEIAEFPIGFPTPDEMDIGVDEKIIEDAGELHFGRTASLAETVRWLATELLVPGASELSPGRAVVSHMPGAPEDKRAAFRMFGSSIAADVRQDLDGKLLVQRILRTAQIRGAVAEGRLVLLQAPLRFSDATTIGRFAGAAREVFEQLINSGTSYLDFWSQYNHAEERLLLRRARSLGWVSYHRVEELENAGGGRWRFYIGEDEELQGWAYRLQDEEEKWLEASERIPEALIAQEGDLGESSSDSRKNDTRTYRKFIGRYVFSDLRQQFIDIETTFGDEDQLAPPDRGVLSLSLLGERRAIQRRKDAEQLIAGGNAPMGIRLRAILEDVPLGATRLQRNHPLTTTTRELLGGNPTKRQVDALDVALNTPDIALIQGPPGTGKTAVIAALQSRIAELSSSRQTVSGRILLSSFQHEAVENAAARTEVFGLPPLKIGSRWGEEVEIDGRLERWSQERADAIAARLATMTDGNGSARLKTLRSLLSGYMASPTDELESISLLKRSITLVDGLIPPVCIDKIQGVINDLAKRKLVGESDLDVEQRELVSKAVRGIRTESVAFADDGPMSARRALIRLQKMGPVDNPDNDLLTNAAEWDLEDTPPFLQELANLRDKYLDLFDGGDARVSRQLNENVVDCLTSTLGYLDAAVSATGEGISDVLSQFANDLKDDPKGVERMVRDYTVVVAATCQQSASRRFSQVARSMDSELDVDKNNARSTFETVIIDEAARANPLDLLIPMSMAQRRIVLVGDHRQLPHMLEPEVEKEIGSSISSDANAALHQSLFERLFLALRKRESIDGVRRTVTLDTQFRMHPALGEFVSRTFYEYHDPEAVLSAGRDENDFAHELAAFDGCVGAWIDVPFSRGRERDGRSRCRPVEAQVVADWVSRVAESRPDLTIGVIAFYSAQVAELWKALAKVGVAQLTENGSYELARQYRETRAPNGQRVERLRVGTVDAFQGREFDVVLLSTTRSNEMPLTNDDSIRRKYGFLTLENRSCVAMSRQRRLLVVVGDSAMTQVEGAERAVRPLVEFRKFCNGPRGKVIA